MCRLTILAVLSVLLGLATAVAEPAAKPTDPQIAHIAYTAGQLDIEAAEQRLQKTKNPQVLLCPADGGRSYFGEQSSARTGQKAQRHAGGQSDQPNTDRAGRRHAQQAFLPRERLSTRLTSITRCPIIRPSTPGSVVHSFRMPKIRS